MFTYDTDEAKNQKGRLASVTNGIVTTAYEYSNRGQVALERTTIDGLSFDTNWTYDAAGRMATLRSPGSITTTTVYAGLRPQSVFVEAGQNGNQSILNLQWLPFGPRRHAELPPYNSNPPPGNRVSSHRMFNLRGQIEDLEVTGPGAATLLHRSYDYRRTGAGAAPNDPGPNLDEMTDSLVGSDSRYYFYDELDRLWKATDLSGNPLFTYTYDAAGNRSQQLTGAGTTSYTYEPGTDRLLRSTGSNPKEYGHDAFGNRIYTGTSPPASGDATHLYNDENRLVQVQTLSPQTVVAQYTYDAFGRRVRKVAGSTTTYYFYDQDGQLLAEATPRANASDIVRRYIFVEGELMGLVDRANVEAGTPAWAPAAWFEIPDNLRPPPGIVLVGTLLLGAALLARPLRRRPLVTAGLVVVTTVSLGSSCDPATTFSWVHTDTLGTPLAVSDSPGSAATPKVIWRASYEPFGKATVNQDPDGDGTTFRLNVRFPGQYFDGESGLHYNYFRTYDSATGRYLEADPIGQQGGLNPFLYVHGNPVTLVDRTGLAAFAIPVLAAALEAAAPAGVVASLSVATVALTSYVHDTIAKVLNENNDPADDGVPPIPSEIYGNKPRNTSGKRVATDLPAEEFERALKDLTGGRLGKTDKPGRSECPNGVGVRAPAAGKGPRIDVPANGSKPPETIHFPENTPWPF